MTQLLTALLQQLGISSQLIQTRNLVCYEQACDLAIAETDPDGRQHQLTPAACKAWHQLKAAALQEGETLIVISAFRSISRQGEIIQNKLNRSQTIQDILKVNAPPGYSEHHTGRALDISVPGIPALETVFENTRAFAWLCKNAQRYGFALSYPRDNPLGYDYEPWHWCFKD